MKTCNVFLADMEIIKENKTYKSEKVNNVLAERKLRETKTKNKSTRLSKQIKKTQNQIETTKQRNSNKHRLIQPLLMTTNALREENLKHKYGPGRK